MKISKILKFAVLSNLIAFSLSAEEIPGQKEFAELSMAITAGRTEINAELSKFKKAQENDAQDSQDRLSELDSLIDKRIKIASVYRNNPSEENQVALLNIQALEEKSKTAIVNKMTDSVLTQIDFADTMSVKYFELANRINQISQLSENFAISKTNALEIQSQITVGIVNSADLVEGLFSDMDEENRQEMEDLLNAIENEALSSDSEMSSLQIDSGIKRQAELLKDYSAHLLKAKRYLENQKKDIAITALQAYISTIESNVTEGVVGSDNLIGQIWGKSKVQNQEIKDFRKIMSKGSSSGKSNYSTSTSNNRRENIEKLRKSLNNE